MLPAESDVDFDKVKTDSASALYLAVLLQKFPPCVREVNLEFNYPSSVRRVLGVGIK